MRFTISTLNNGGSVIYDSGQDISLAWRMEETHWMFENAIVKALEACDFGGRWINTLCVAIYSDNNKKIACANNFSSNGISFTCYHAGKRRNEVCSKWQTVFKAINDYISNDYIKTFRFFRDNSLK